MNLTDERDRLQKELDETTEQLTKLSAKCTLLKAKIRKVDKGLAANKKLLDELNGEAK